MRCSVDTAYRTWVERIDAWWPRGHSRSGDPDTTVFLEGRIGGRVYERTPDGVEHDWGRISTWDPPRHFAYHWYLGSGPEQPTIVDVHFTPTGDGSTQVIVEHRGPELIGELWSRNSPRYDGSWDDILPAFVAICSG